MEPSKSALRVEGEVRAASERLISHEIAKNFETVASVYAPDAVLQVANRPQVEGRAAIFKAYQEFFTDALELHGSPTKILAASSCDMAVEYGSNRIVFDSPDGPVEVRGKYSRGWMKTEGAWQIVVQTYSPDAGQSG